MARCRFSAAIDIWHWKVSAISFGQMASSSGDESMKSHILADARTDAPVSDRVLRGIVEQGFFGAPGSLADARAACAELIFAREIIKAQTTRIAQLDSGAFTIPIS